MLKALFELIKLVIEFFKDSYDRQVAEQDKRDALAGIPKTPEEAADEDIQKVQAAAVGGNADALMREFERLRFAAMGAGTATADTAADSGESDSDTVGS